MNTDYSEVARFSALIIHDQRLDSLEHLDCEDNNIIVSEATKPYIISIIVIKPDHVYPLEKVLKTPQSTLANLLSLLSSSKIINILVMKHLKSNQ